MLCFAAVADGGGHKHISQGCIDLQCDTLVFLHAIVCVQQQCVLFLRASRLVHLDILHSNSH